MRGSVFILADFHPLSDVYRRGFLAVGNFDGVHRGHQALIERLRDRADRAGARAMALTFDPRPVDVLRPGTAPAALTWTDRKVELLEQAGAHDVGVFQTGRWLLGLTAREFFERIVLGQLDARGMVEGPTFGFGRDRGGDAQILAEWCGQAGLEFEIVHPVEIDGDLVTSTRIRRALAEGDAASAARWLGRLHRIQGRVVPGAGRGAPLGFPTANLDDIRGVIPAHGVYAAWAVVEGHPQALPAAVHIGPNATFGAVAATVEAHLLDFAGNLYDRALAIDFVAQIRETRKFTDVAALLDQIRDDVARSRSILSSEPPGPAGTSRRSPRG
jgi:riboflavin kinase/FMN adenylyltransferase